MDARQRLLDALAELDRLDRASRGERCARRFEHANHELDLTLRSLLPTLAALKEVVETHKQCEHDEYCSECFGCSEPAPHGWLLTLTRQFEEG